MNLSITVNGVAREAEVEPRTLLVDLIRDGFGLTGTKIACDTSQCGACTVHLDGRSVKSCTLLAVQANGAEVTTIEGLASNGDLHAVQQAFHEAVFASWLPPRVASLCFALTFVLFWYAILLVLHRKRIYVRV